MASTDNIVKQVLDVSDDIQDGRNIQDILTHTTTELGELGTEVQIVLGKTYKEPGTDGVVGEAIDVILCALDMIKVYRPDVTEEEINRIAARKIQKWVEKSNERLSN